MKSRERVPSVLLVILHVGHVIRLELVVRRKTSPIAAAKMTSCKQREGSLYFLRSCRKWYEYPFRLSFTLMWVSTPTSRCRERENLAHTRGEKTFLRKQRGVPLFPGPRGHLRVRYPENLSTSYAGSKRLAIETEYPRMAYSCLYVPSWSTKRGVTWTSPLAWMLRLFRSSSTFAPFIRVQLDLYSVYKGPARPASQPELK